MGSVLSVNGGGSYRLLLCLARGLESFLLPCTISMFIRCEVFNSYLLLESGKVSRKESPGDEVKAEML